MNKPLRLFLIEDNDADVFFFREATRNAATKVDLETCPRGDLALEKLHEASRQGVLPDLLLIDLNLPRMGGVELLEQLAATPSLAAIPALVLSSSNAPGDIQACYARGARAYLVKPMDFEELASLVSLIIQFWSSVARPV